MCGIGGIIRLDGGDIESWRLEAMNKAMYHRGPDGEGYWQNESVGLAHLRLAIIDLATGNQPMFNEDGSIVVIFNGEIYNFLELRPILQSRGHIFKTKSDTETLVHAYEEWGAEMVSKLNGMFAFVIYDCSRRKLFLARDRLGVKPLYYYLGPDVFVFASEMQGLLASNLIPREIDPEALELYLHYQYIPAPYSIYRQVKKLPPAEWAELILPTKQFKTSSYWDIATYAHVEQSKSMAEWREELHTLLDDAVRIRLISDVPFGAFLSGGTDSGLIVALMAQKLSEPVHTFSIGLTNEATNETLYARQVAQKYHTHHEEFYVSPEGLTLIPKLVTHFGEPFADSSAIPTYYVSQIARSKVKMVLTGDGGDEMFAGYIPYITLALAQMSWSKILPMLSEYWLKNAGAALSSSSNQLRQTFLATKKVIGTTLRQVKRLPWYITHDAWMSHFNSNERQALLAQNNGGSRADYLAQRFPYPAADSMVASAQYCDLKSYLPGDILVKVDRMSMANSLEIRSPLLDYRIAELAFSMPLSLKLPKPYPDGSTGKFILKELAAQYLGRDYVYRPKLGFGIPIGRWLREDKANYLKDTLNNSSPIYNYLDRQAVQPLIKAHLSGQSDNAFKLWNLLLFDGWLRYIHSPQAT
ncbi:MAG: asparagine synthase (glutamine-hydrolyzing) [Anaerolineales bacterium]|nr:asparagine synthase (glutamine-hydrolyzing) [Anaerolineales bacterium]